MTFYSDDTALPVDPQLSRRLPLSTDSAGKIAGDSSYPPAPIAQRQKNFTAFVVECGHRIKLIGNFFQSSLMSGIWVFCHAAFFGIMEVLLASVHEN